MKTNSMRPLTSRRAFTLIELIVVLMILVGLATVLIPAVTDMVTRTNRSATSTNISEIAGSIQRYEAQFMQYPDNFDSLMRNPTTPVRLNTLLSSLTDVAVTEDVVLTNNTIASLTAAGLTNFGIHANNDDTFALPSLSTLAAGDSLMGLTPAKQVALGLETTGATGKYVLLGIGALSEMNGKTMLDAPVHFPRDSVSNPETKYCRFLAIFQITDGSVALTRAKFVGVLAPDAQSLSTELGGYFQIAANN